MSIGHQTPLAGASTASWHPVIWSAAGIIMAVLLAFLLMVVPPQYGWLLLVGVAVASITLARPLAGLYLLPFVVAFGSLFSVNLHGLNAGLTDLLIGTLAVSTLWHTWFSRNGDRRTGQLEQRHQTVANLRSQAASFWKRNRMLVLTLAAFLTYLGVVTLSVSVAESKSLALKEVIKWTEVLVLLLAALQLIRSVHAIHGIVWAIIGAGVCQALLGYWQWIQVTGSHSASADSLRVFGTFGQPNPFAGYLNFALLLALSLVLFSSEIRERWLAGAALTIILFAAILADSRGAELGLAVAIMVLIILALGQERLVGIALLIGVPVLALAWFAHLIPSHIRGSLLQQVSLGPVNSANFSVQERLAHWVAGLRMFRAHPILGVGAGNYGVAYPHYQVSPDWFEALGHAHNYYINAAAETGILGLVAILSLVGSSLFAGWLATRVWAKVRSLPPLPARADTRIGWALALGLLAALVAHSVHNLTDDLFVHGMELQFALCVACLLCLLHLGNETLSSTAISSPPELPAGADQAHR